MEPGILFSGALFSLFRPFIDSYVANYFANMEQYLMVGVPVYFVIEGKYNYHLEPYRNLVCGSAGCDLYSLAEQVSRAAEQPEKYESSNF